MTETAEVLLTMLKLNVGTVQTKKPDSSVALPADGEVKFQSQLMADCHRGAKSQPERGCQARK